MFCPLIQPFAGNIRVDIGESHYRSINESGAGQIEECQAAGETGLLALVGGRGGCLCTTTMPGVRADAIGVSAGFRLLHSCA